jgi:polar amino acid transport system substrate-binding protein
VIVQGALRAALVKIPFLAREDGTGALVGVAPDLAEAMALRLGIACERTAFDAPNEGIAALREGRADVTFLAPTPERVSLIDFAPAFMELEVTLIVPPGSPIKTLADADRVERRIVVYERTAVEEIMRKTIVHATLVPVPIFGHKQGFDLLKSGAADALADLRHALVTYQPDLEGSQILPGSYGSNALAIGYAKGRPELAAFVRDFTLAARTSGLVAQAIQRAGVHGARVPAGG